MIQRHKSLFLILALAATLLALAAVAAPPADDQVDLGMITRIRQEGLRNSKVMDILEDLSDRIGPRLTGSPNAMKANEWTRDQMKSWGLENAHLEEFDFGRSWALDSVSVRMLNPDTTQLIAFPLAWSPATDGPVRGQVVRVDIKTKEDFEKYKGQLAGKIVLLEDMREVKPQDTAALVRYDEKRLADIGAYSIGPERRYGTPEQMREMMARRRMRVEINKFLAEEKAVVILEPSRGDGGMLFVQGMNRGWDKNGPAAIPTLVLAIENYGRIMRLLDHKQPVEIEVNLKSSYNNEGGKAYNTVAEIPGTDKKDEIVMLGAHLDSWHGGTGTTDNGAGTAVIMEAVRILKALDVKPRRTIRVGLWMGEEQGLLGSRAYIKDHVAERPTPPNMDQEARDIALFSGRTFGPIQIKPEYQKISAYFNIDNGTGKIRGIYAQENAAVVPLFQNWLRPFNDLGATTVTMRNTSGTDHLSFDAVGVPGFQFIQDPVEYETRTHHSNMDVYERAQREDLMQAAVILASFVYNTAMRDEMMPRKPLNKDDQAALDKYIADQKAAAQPVKKGAKPAKKPAGMQ